MPPRDLGAAGFQPSPCWRGFIKTRDRRCQTAVLSVGMQGHYEVEHGAEYRVVPTRLVVLTRSPNREIHSQVRCHIRPFEVFFSHAP